MPTPADPRPILCIVDDDDAFRDSLSALLECEGFDLAAAASADEFLATIPAGRPACALVDLHMPRRDGFDVLAALAARPDPPPVIMMTGQGDVRSAVRAMKAGALDFIEKPFERADLLRLVETAFAASRRSAMKARDRHAFRERHGRLTDREREVCDRMLRGKPSKIIAHELDISPRTVEIHRSRVLQKLEVDGVPDLIRAAVRADMVNDDPA